MLPRGESLSAGHLTFSSDETISITAGGKISRGLLAAPAIVDGKNYPAKTLLEFDEKGKVTNSTRF